MSLRAIQAGQPGVLPALARAGLGVLALAWRAALGGKRLAYALGLRRRHALPVPVVCVGNVTVGGTGKTPCVIWLARRLQAAGRHPGILARGYGAALSHAGGLNDEGAVILHALGPGVPQVQDGDRLRGGRALLAAHPDVDVLLLDDGFQHWSLRRDLDIVLVDATCPFGFGRLLPRGRLREPTRALRRAGVVLVTRAERVPAGDLAALRARLAGLTAAPVAIARTEVTGPTASLRGAHVLACGGLGNPDAFLGALADLGAHVVGRRLWADHAPLPAGGWAGLLEEARRLGAQRVVTTRKDAVKHPRLPAEVTIVDAETVIVEGEEALWGAVEGSLLRPRRRA